MQLQRHRETSFAHPSCSYYYLLSPSILFLHILLFCIFIPLHILLLFIFFYHIYALVLCYFLYFYFILLHCPLSGPDLIYISLLIIPCIIYYVTNKQTLNLQKTHANRKSTSKSRKHLHQFDSRWCKCS